jgi:proline iminopeptidase
MNILKIILITLCFCLSIVNSNANAQTITYGDGELFQGKYGKLYFEAEGQGTPVVLINGGPGAGHAVFLGWFDFLLKNGYQVVYFDETGRGRATREVVGKALTPQMGVDDLESLRLHLKADKLILLAHSYGGIQGLQYALQYPQHVEKLIMVDASYDAKSHQMNIDHVKHVTKTKYPERWEQVLTLRANKVKSTDNRYSKLLSVGSDMYWYDLKKRKTMRKVRTGDKRDGSNMQVYFDIIGDDPEWQVNGTLSGLQVESKLKAFNVPTLIIGGRHDKITTPEIVHRLYSMMPKNIATKVMFEKSGHWPWVEETEKFELSITTFLTNAPNESLTK